MATTPDVSDRVPGGYPGTPQHEQTVDEDAVNKEIGYYVEKIKESLPSSLTGNSTENKDNTDNKGSGNYLEKIKESLPSISLPGSGTENKESRNIENNATNKDSVSYVERFKESLPSNPFAGNSTENKDNTGNSAENKKSINIENNAENKDSGTYLEKIKESLPSNPLAGSGTENKESRNMENNAENKDSGTYLEKIKESLPSNPLAGSGTENKESSNIENNAENKDSGTYLEKIKESLPSNPLARSGTENKESRKIENNPENKALGDDAEKSKDDQIRESFPLRFEPDHSKVPKDDNDLTKVSNKGSSALGGVGVNPAALLGIGSESPRHPFYRDNPPEAAGGFDLTGDYNKQKEQEQTAEHKAKLAQKQDKLDHKQKSEDKKHEKPERIDLGVKPLGNQQQPPLPYKPEEAAGGTDHIPPSKTTVHPEGHSPKATKKDKVNATMGRAVGTLKQKIGKLVKSDSLSAKGTEEKAEAAELKKSKEF